MNTIDITLTGEHADRWNELRGRFRSDAALMEALLGSYGEVEDYDGRGEIRDWSAPEVADGEERTCVLCANEIVEGEDYCTAILVADAPPGALYAHDVCLG